MCTYARLKYSTMIEWFGNQDSLNGIQMGNKDHYALDGIFNSRTLKEMMISDVYNICDIYMIYVTPIISIVIYESHV
jgi:hypothetical protein